MARGLRWTQEQLDAHRREPAQFHNPHPDDVAAKVQERISLASELEDAKSANGELAFQCSRAGILYAREVEFHPTRGWRLDFIFPHPSTKLALEINGGLFVEGRHTQGAALLKEYEKLCEAAIAGYRVLLVTPKDVKKGRALALIRRALAHPHQPNQQEHT